MGKGILDELNKSGISVTEIANQSWCEYKVYLSCLHKEKPTRAMQAGTMAHRKLQKEVYKELVVEPVTYPDIFYKSAYENITTMQSLVRSGKGRELKISGKIDGFTVRGQIDELLSENGEIVVVENKTSRNEHYKEMYGKQHSVQVMLYKRMFDDIKNRKYTYKDFYDANSIYRMKLSPKFLEGLQGIGTRKELLGIGAICSEMFDDLMALPKISDRLLIRYMNPDSSELFEEVELRYDKEALDRTIAKDMGFWNKERPPEPVPKEEGWKCKTCQFFKDKTCSVSPLLSR